MVQFYGGTMKRTPDEVVQLLQWGLAEGKINDVQFNDFLEKADEIFRAAIDALAGGHCDNETEWEPNRNNVRPVSIDRGGVVEEELPRKDRLD